MSYRASIIPNVVVPFHRWTTCGPRQLHTKFGPNIRTTSIPAGPLSFMFSHFTIQNFILQFEQRPPLRGPLNKINNRYDTIFFLLRVDHQVSEEAIHQIWSRYLKDLSRYTHLVPSSLLFDTPLRHVVFSQYQTNMVVPFHRWTNCGPRQLHFEFGPNIRTTSIPAGPLLLMFSYFTIQNFRLQFDPPPSRSTQ